MIKSAPAVDIDAVRSFWEAHPLCADAIPHPLGSREYFEHYDRLREANESVEFSATLHEYAAFAGKRVLDVGCGNGYVLSRYAQAGALTTGVDLTRAAVELCRRRFEYAHLPGDFRQANAEALPFADDTFDCVTSMGVLHHTPDTVAAVSEVFRVLKPEGRLIVMFYHRNSALYRIGFPLQRMLTGKSMQQLTNDVDGSGNPLGDVYSAGELRRLLGRFGELELFTGLLEPWMVLPRFSRLLPAALLNPFARRWGWFLYARGRKPVAA